MGPGERLVETRPPTELGAEDMVEEKLLLPFVCTFHRDYTPFLSAIQEHFRAMQPGWEVPRQARVIRALRKNPSLGDILVRAKLEGRVRTPPEKLLCHLVHRHMVSNPHSGRTWPANFQLIPRTWCMYVYVHSMNVCAFNVVCVVLCMWEKLGLACETAFNNTCLPFGHTDLVPC